jgi:hypothetical protein
MVFAFACCLMQTVPRGFVLQIDMVGRPKIALC